MRILRGLYHFLLFLIVSWTIYYTFMFIWLILPPSDNKYLEMYIVDGWNFYLLGALDFPKLVTQISNLLHSLLNPRVLRDFWPFLIYSFGVNGLAAFNWLYNQNPLSACFLALAPCIAGPYLGLLFLDGMVLIYGIAGIIIFYAILYKLNDYCKRRFPKLTLPAWLEWRRPNMLPSLKSIAHKMERMFRKSSS